VTPSSEEILLTTFQLEVAQLFFSLPASHGFVLAGGAALIAQHLTSRPTQDLDFFTAREADVVAARDELMAAAHERRWARVRADKALVSNKSTAAWGTQPRVSGDEEWRIDKNAVQQGAAPRAWGTRSE
jgi:nucleotidyltransferase AbiEii toxin of type IV toxin-antitoxin system